MGNRKVPHFCFGKLRNNSYIYYYKQFKNKVMAKYYSVTVAVEVEDAKGKIKKNKEQYLVDALSCTEAEAKLVKKFTADAVRLEYEVVKVSETKIIEVF
jgi:hypothetical protein